MVIFKKIAASGKYQDPQAIPDVVAYITQTDKTPSGIILGMHVDMQDIANSMIAVSEYFGKNSHIRLHHFVLSFPSKDLPVLPQVLHEICSYIGRIYQVVAALHEDTGNPHIHFVFNAVSFINGYKYHGGKEDYYELVSNIESILYKYGSHPLIAVKYSPIQELPHE